MINDDNCSSEIDLAGQQLGFNPCKQIHVGSKAHLESIFAATFELHLKTPLEDLRRFLGDDTLSDSPSLVEHDCRCVTLRPLLMQVVGEVSPLTVF